MLWDLAARRPDRVGAVRILLDAGASREDVWITDQPPSDAVAAVLHAYGVYAPDEEG